MQAIPTEYKGVMLRSRFEADMAFLLDALAGCETDAGKRSWEYEPQSFLLSDGTHYMPDFYVPALNLWIECRGYVSEKGERQIEGFAARVRSGAEPCRYLVVRGRGSALYDKGLDCSPLLFHCEACDSWSLSVWDGALRDEVYCLRCDAPFAGLAPEMSNIRYSASGLRVVRLDDSMDADGLSDGDDVRTWVARTLRPRAGAIAVYLAGKISKWDWRGVAFDGMDDVWDDVREDHYPRLRSWRPQHGPFTCVGPFFMSDDHGCGHGDGSHGVAAGREICAPYGRRPRGWVASQCLEWIDEADVLFVWLDGRDAYGTLAEIGYARARGIPVWLYEPCDVASLRDELTEMEELEEAWNEHDREVATLMRERLAGFDDLWFARALASQVHGANSPGLAWEHFSAHAPARLGVKVGAVSR